ncbi:MAG: hypothetical protein ACK5JT_06305, partial [Hyphomicrobiaceae bacterium]
MSKMIQAGLVVVAAVFALGAVVVCWPDIMLWARAQQFTMQTSLARSIQAVEAGNGTALAGLFGACALYGVLHAVGPGHGKLLIGGAALTSRRTAWRMASIGFSASLLQAVSAIVLAYGGLGLVSATGAGVIGNANLWLVPMSYVAMALVGLWIAARGARLLLSGGPAEQAAAHSEALAHGAHDHGHDHACGCSADAHQHAVPIAAAHHVHGSLCGPGCRHMPTAREVEKAGTWRDV